MPRVKDTDSFVAKAEVVHGFKYIYDVSTYTRSKELIRIQCPVHGYFDQIAGDHLNGAGCPSCSGNKKLDTESFIQRARLVHRDKFSYEKTRYVNSKKHVVIHCPIHGDFEQAPGEHLMGKGCYACSGRKKKTTEEFVADAKAKHGDKYSYDFVEYETATKKVIITCAQHGNFEQTPNNHLSGYGCAKCAGCAPNSNEDFLDQANSIHGQYSYPREYQSARIKMDIHCPVHGVFHQRPADHVNSRQGCPSCWSSRSSYELELENFLKENKIEHAACQREAIAPQELDFYLPQHSLAVEINGLWYHSDEFRTKDYHYEKYRACEEKGIRLLHVNEDEWVKRPEAIKNKILNLCGMSERGPGARKLSVRSIDFKEASAFTDRHHIQGGLSNMLYGVGAFLDESLVGVMTFSKQRGTGKTDLSRFCSDGKIYAGMFSKLFSHAQREVGFEEVVTFADRRYSDGRLYIAAGFEYTGDSPVDYRYVKGKTTYSKRSFTKADIKRRFGLEGGTERDMMASLGYRRIYDCGKMRFVWRK